MPRLIPPNGLQKTNGVSAGSVYEQLRREIISMRLLPGQSLDEKSLVEKHGVSRTPVREALIRLAGDGLVDLTPNRGASVATLDLATLRAIFEAGDFLEKAMLRLACARRSETDLQAITQHQSQFETDLASNDVTAMVESNTQFHLAIAQAADNKYLQTCYRRILADHERIGHIWYQHLVNVRDDGTHDRIITQHRELVLAIRERAYDKGEKISQQHAALCKDGVREILADGERLLADIAIQPMNEI